MRLLYPALSLPGRSDIHQNDKGQARPGGHLVRTAGILILAICLVAPAVSGIKIRNSLRGMYTMSDQLMEWEKKAASVLDLGSTGEYFIVTGRGQQELLAREEQLAAKLELEKGVGTLGGYTAISSFIPSMAHQARSYKAAELLLQRSPLQLKALGFGSAAAGEFARDYRNCAGRIVTTKNAPSFLKESIETLYLGKVLVQAAAVRNDMVQQPLVDGRRRQLDGKQHKTHHHEDPENRPCLEQNRGHVQRHGRRRVLEVYGSLVELHGIEK